MHSTLKNLSATQQIGALFIIVFGLLMLAGVALFLLSLRVYDDSALAERHRRLVSHLGGQTR